ncbi:MAG: class I SAM-dependent methyltransferase [Bacteroidetes bacterium]|nr:MAG: class I SAM-dependent methyltransferase [Bacteroidota bacterium]
MPIFAPHLHQRLAAAFVRGTITDMNELFNKVLFELKDQQINELIEIGQRHGLKLSVFYNAQELNLYAKVIQLLKNIQPDNLLDLGSGRGTFVWQFLDNFPFISLTVVENQSRFVQNLQAVYKGGFGHLKIIPNKLTDLAVLQYFEFDVVTAIQVIEYLPDYQSFLKDICRLAKRFIVLTVAKNNSNPNCVHQFDEDEIRNMFGKLDIFQLKIESIPNYWIIIARK